MFKKKLFSKRRSLQRTFHLSVLMCGSLDGVEWEKTGGPFSKRNCENNHGFDIEFVKSALCRNRTCHRQLRRLLLYPTELRMPPFWCCSKNVIKKKMCFNFNFKKTSFFWNWNWRGRAFSCGFFSLARYRTWTDTPDKTGTDFKSVVYTNFTKWAVFQNHGFGTGGRKKPPFSFFAHARSKNRVHF